ncbi:transposase, partial [Ralstonia pseudosolanacearum]|uniref:transposase n=1 Tax=Ralstonia pseudosolanacearum TaxID=1310165 RepID=UPI0018D1BCBA
MKTSKFTEAQIAFALKQAELGTKVEEVCRKGNADLSGSAVIADVAEDVAEGSSRSGPTTMKKQTSFSEA